MTKTERTISGGAQEAGRIVTQIERYKSDQHIVNEPFYFEGTNGKGVLLLHGWSSTPYEMRALGERLHDEGYSVYAPLLTGHGTKAEDLQGVVWQEWMNDARTAYAALQEKCSQVFVGGISLGGTLALHLARRHPEIAGMILMSTPYKLRYEVLGYYVSQIVMPFRTWKTKNYPIQWNRDICLTQLISYQRYPLKSVHEVYYAIKTVLHHLSDITQPALILQSTTDHLIDSTSLRSLETSLGSSMIEKKLIKNAYHNFIGDSAHHHLYDDIVRFVKKTA